jgi:long-subunit fatty acid transport protein
VEAIASDGSPFVDINLRGGNYSTFRTLAKIGGYFASESFSAGLTFTTPSLHITGSGEFGINEAVFNSDTTVLLATIQPDLSATYKSPLSVGLGIGWQVGKARINASGEWFDKIDPYVVMQGEEFIQQEPTQPITFDVVQSMDEVFNWGLGLEYEFRETFSGYASFATDAPDSRTRSSA